MNGMPEQINRPLCKQQCKDLLHTAQVRPMAFAALYLLLYNALDLLSSFVSVGGVIAIFINILTWLLINVLSAGFILYCMDIRRNVHSPFLTLFDGFAFAGKLIALILVQTIFVALWSMLFVIPGIVASYRYSFALYDICENPELGVMEALSLSKKQTWGYKRQLFTLDLSYIGWTLLAALPEILYSSWQEMQELMSAAYFYYDQIALPATPLYLSALFALWSLAVQIFYLPQYQCVQLAYYDTAKRTSGITSASRRDFSDWDFDDE